MMRMVTSVLSDKQLAKTFDGKFPLLNILSKYTFIVMQPIYLQVLVTSFTTDHIKTPQRSHHIGKSLQAGYSLSSSH